MSAARIVFSHGTGEDAGMSHVVKEDLYTTASGSSCLLFDLAVHSVSAPSGTRTPRALTAPELARVNQALDEIFLSVRIERAKPAN